jgi:hypothetical protein
MPRHTAFATLLLFIIYGCANQNAPSGVALTATPASIAPGAPATLSWTSITDATSCSIDNGVGSVPCAASSKVVEPATTTTYTFTATGTGGSKTSTATVTVTNITTPTATPTPAGVTPVTPTLGTFVATPATIPVGGTTLLSWRGIVNADHCLINNGVGVVSCADSSISVSPPGTIASGSFVVPYTLTAVGIDASVSTTVNVTVTAH